MQSVLTRRAYMSLSPSLALNFNQTVIRLTIETGTVTAIAAIVDLVFFVRAHNGLHQVSGVILCKLYSNTLLVLFNNRLVMNDRTKSDYSSNQTLSFNASPPPIRSNLEDSERTLPDIRLELMEAGSRTERKKTSGWVEEVEPQP